LTGSDEFHREERHDQFHLLNDPAPTQNKSLEPQNDLPTWSRWIPITGNVALAVLVCFLIVFVKVREDTTAAIMIGFLFVQILLAAVWTVLAPVGMFTRVVIGTAFVTLICLCMYRCAYRDGGGTSMAVAITGAMFVQWLLFQIPLWYLRFAGWKLVTSGQPIANRREEVQFGIKHLLIWMTVIGVFMGIARFVIPNLEIETSELSQAAWLGSFLTLGNSVIAMPIVWGCLSKNYFWLWMIITVFVCISVCGAETMISPSMQWVFLWVINVSQAIISVLVMLALRFTGYRLHQATI